LIAVKKVKRNIGHVLSFSSIIWGKPCSLEVNKDYMKGLFAILFVFLLTACNWTNSENKNIISENPYLVGIWEGQGRLMDVNVTDKVGDIHIKIVIEDDQNITLSLGDIEAKNVKIKKANFGFEILGELPEEISKTYPLKKSHAIILLVLPEENRDQTDFSLGNFHLKTNYTFDFSMRVGGVKLQKTSH
jgi:hypothetical protein